MIIDNFLDSFNELYDYAKSADFRAVVNPVDNVSYPHICDYIPDGIKREIYERIEEFTGKGPSDPVIFIRRSPEGVHCPHIVHNDLSMGKYSLMLYLNDNDKAGTAMVRHIETGMCYNPESEEFVKIAQKDQNDPDKWMFMNGSTMKKNRAYIFDAGLFHCAVPIGGFGEGSEARTVLTVFFS